MDACGSVVAELKEYEKTSRFFKESLASVCKVGEERRLEPKTLVEFTRFFVKRFPQHSVQVFDKHYADDWAKRFSERTEWFYADNASRSVLKQVNPSVYGDKWARYKLTPEQKEKVHTHLNANFNPKEIEKLTDAQLDEEIKSAL